MKDFAKKMLAAFWQHPHLMAASFVAGLVIGCIWMLITHPEFARRVMFGG